MLSSAKIAEISLAEILLAHGIVLGIALIIFHYFPMLKVVSKRDDVTASESGV